MERNKSEPPHKIVERVADSIFIPEHHRPILSAITKIQELLGIGKYITRAAIIGGPGEKLDIKLGGIDLSTLLPPETTFYGYAYSHEQTLHGHHYGARKKRCSFVVQCKSKEKYYKPIQETNINGLIILHEMGHAWRDYQNPERRQNIYRYWLSNFLLENISQDLCNEWYEDSIAFCKRYNAELSKENVAKYFLEHLQRYLSLEVLALVEKHEMRDFIAVDTSMKIQKEVIGRVVSNMSERLKSVSSAPQFWREIGMEKMVRETEYSKYRKQEVMQEETEAWKWALDAAQMLQKKNKRIKLWDNSEESLRLLMAFFILHHKEIKLNDLPEGKVKSQLMLIRRANKLS